MVLSTTKVTPSPTWAVRYIIKALTVALGVQWKGLDARYVADSGLYPSVY